MNQKLMAMITIKNEHALRSIRSAGERLALLFAELAAVVLPGVTTAAVDAWIAQALSARGMLSPQKGYRGYRHVSCVSINQELVHGIPSKNKVLQAGDLVKVDVCASWKGYCADMARCFVLGATDETQYVEQKRLAHIATLALDEGIEQMRFDRRLGDVSAAIQREIEKHGCGVVRDFCGHGIGKRMHEEPEIPNYGEFGTGPRLKPGMVFALEPMLTAGDYRIEVAQDGWTAYTVDGSLAAHVEDTVIVTEAGPEVVTRLQDARNE